MRLRLKNLVKARFRKRVGLPEFFSDLGLNKGH